MPGRTYWKDALRAFAGHNGVARKERAKQRSAVFGLFLLGRLRLGALLGSLGLDAGRPADTRRSRLARLRPLPEVRPALRRQLRLLLDHAGGDGIDVRHELAAQPHRIRRAGLLLLRRVGETNARLDQHGQGKPRDGSKNGLPKAKRRHRFPQMSNRGGVWVNGRSLATRAKPKTGSCAVSATGRFAYRLLRRHAPPRRSIQYAAASRPITPASGILDPPPSRGMTPVSGGYSASYG